MREKQIELDLTGIQPFVTNIYQGSAHRSLDFNKPILAVLTLGSFLTKGYDRSKSQPEGLPSLIML